MANLLILLAGAIPALRRDNLPGGSPGRSNQCRDELPILSRFEFPLALHRFTSGIESLSVNYNPWKHRSRKNAPALVMPFEPLLQVICVSDVITPISLAL